MIVLVTGSRNWDDPDIIKDSLWMHAGKYGSHNTVIHGGATGADMMSGHAARMLGYGEKVYPADWVKHGKRAGYVRNKYMVDLGPDLCLAFIKNESKGASMCAKLAEEAGIPTIYYRMETDGN